MPPHEHQRQMTDEMAQDSSLANLIGLRTVETEWNHLSETCRQAHGACTKHHLTDNQCVTPYFKTRCAVM